MTLYWISSDGSWEKFADIESGNAVSVDEGRVNLSSELHFSIFFKVGKYIKCTHNSIKMIKLLEEIK